MKKNLLLTFILSLSVFCVNSYAQSLVKVGNVTSGGILDIQLFAPQTAIAYTSTAVYKSTDGGTSWNLIGDFFSNEPYNYRGLFAHSENRIFTTLSSGGRVRNTNNGAKPWTEVTVGRNQAGSDVFFIDSLNGFLVLNGNSGSVDTPYIYVSTDGGLNWSFKSKISEKEYSSKIYFVDANKGWLWASNHVYYTTDGGSTWNASTYPSDKIINNLQMLDESTGYIAGANDGLFKTTDGGINWTLVEDASSWSVGDMYFFDTNTGYIVEYKSSDSRVRKTTNGGSTWTEVATGQHVRNIVVADTENILFFGTNNNVWKLPEGTNTNLSEVEFITGKVYPNPFIQVVNLTVNRPIAEANLFNVYGQLCAKFTNLNAGEHQLILDSKLVNGIYFLKLSDATGEQVIKLIKQ